VLLHYIGSLYQGTVTRLKVETSLSQIHRSGSLSTGHKWRHWTTWRSWMTSHYFPQHAEVPYAWCSSSSREWVRWGFAQRQKFGDIGGGNWRKTKTVARRPYQVCTAEQPAGTQFECQGHLSIPGIRVPEPTVKDRLEKRINSWLAHHWYHSNDYSSCAFVSSQVSIMNVGLAGSYCTKSSSKLATSTARQSNISVSLQHLWGWPWYPEIGN